MVSRTACAYCAAIVDYRWPQHDSWRNVGAGARPKDERTRPHAQTNKRVNLKVLSRDNFPWRCLILAEKGVGRRGSAAEWLANSNGATEHRDQSDLNLSLKREK